MLGLGQSSAQTGRSGPRLRLKLKSYAAREQRQAEDAQGGGEQRSFHGFGFSWRRGP
jgi:hypothetical protein